MSKRYYYTCPIKTAYMNHEFGVITYVELSIESEIFDKYFIKDWNHRELKLDPKEKHCRDKYYVAEESEHIFEPKKGDLAHYDLNGGSGVYQFTNKPIRWAEGVTNIQIIRRDNKQFFYPEVEND